MKKTTSSTIRAYLAGFLDGDGSIYARLKPNADYRYGYQVALYIVLFQSAKDRKKFEELCARIDLGSLRKRNDGILEYTINKIDHVKEFLSWIRPFAILKRKQVELMLKIIKKKQSMQSRRDFVALAKLIDSFRELNYSKKRKYRTLTP